MSKRKWNPETIGCDCQSCPLKEYPFPVPPEEPKIGRGKLVLLGESPGKNEVIEQRPFVGASGWELEKGLKKFNIRRDECRVTNAILCRPKREMNPKDWNKAIKCCNPRLLNEIDQNRDVTTFPMGGRALQSTFGKSKITKWRGSPLETEKFGTILPSVHPALVLRKPAVRPIFQTDLSRAVRLHNGTLPEFKWPEFYVGGDKAEQLRYLREIAAAGLPIGVDVETKGANPLFAGLLAIGVSNTLMGVSVIWTEDEDIRAAFQECFDKCVCVTQNGSHDVLSLRAHGFRIVNGFDTLLAHAVAAPNLRHGLEFIASNFFWMEKWKTIAKVEKDLKGAEGWEKWRDRDPIGFKLYNVKDCAATVLLKRPLELQLDKRHKGNELYQEYMGLQDVCMRMKKHGIQTNKKKIYKARIYVSEEAKKYKELVEAKIAELNVEGVSLGKNGQHPSLRKLFFEHFKLTPKSRTNDGKPRCDKDFLESIPRDSEPGEIAQNILSFRRRMKILSTYILGLPKDQNGVVHPDFKCWGAITGRFASASPNMQNIPKGLIGPEGSQFSLRDMFQAFPGHYLISCDYSGLEAAIIAFYAGDEQIMQEYTDRVDLHIQRAYELFGKRIVDKIIENNDKGTEEGKRVFKRTRALAKMATYQCMPISTQALTIKGWKQLTDIEIGEIVLGYNPETRQKEWTRVTGKVPVHKAEGIEMSVQGNGKFKMVSTANHRWFTFNRTSGHKVKTTEELNAEDNIIVNAPIKAEIGVFEEIKPKDSDVLKEVLTMSSSERRAFLWGFLLADGSYHRDTWVMHQKDGPRADAVYTAAYIEHPGRIYKALKGQHTGMMSARFTKKSHVTCQRLVRKSVGKMSMTCLETELGSFIARQGDYISITGNCQYGGTPEALFKSLSTVFTGLTLAEVKLFHRRFFEAHPKIKEFHEYLERIAYNEKYVEAPLSQRRQYFYDRIEMGKVYNYPAQGTGADLINRALKKLDSLVDWETIKIVSQVHDELNVSAEDPAKAFRLVKDCMEQTAEYQGRSFKFRVDGEIGVYWGSLTGVSTEMDIREYCRKNPPAPAY